MPRKKKSTPSAAAPIAATALPSASSALPMIVGEGASVPSTGSLPEHSPLGASSAERWMNCSGSVALAHAIKTGEGPEEDDPDYRRDGVQAHALAAWCLNNDADAWEGAAEYPDLTEEMMSAVQVFLDFARKLPGRRYVEQKMHRPEFHAQAFGTMDLATVMVTTDEADFADYKHGEGIIVEVENNVQIMYYVFLFVGDDPAYPDDMVIRLHIVQPRAPHFQGPIRTWTTTVGHIRRWAHTELWPAMERTMKDRFLSVGPWCRFCPAKLVCPAMTSLADEFTFRRDTPLGKMPAEMVGDFYQKWQWLKMFGKSIEAETVRRVLAIGEKVPGVKAVKKKANRDWKEGAEAAAKEKFPADALYTKPEFLSPAGIEKLADGKVFVHEWAYTPDVGLTIALESDPKPAVSVRPEDKYGDPKKLLDGANAAE